MDMIPGSLVLALLLAIGWFLEAPLLFALFGSFAFGATAIASTGGSTIPVFMGMAGLVLLATLLRRTTWRDLGIVLRSQPLAHLACIISIYAVCSAYLFPRFFEGQTTVVVPIDSDYSYLPLAPVSGNTNQAVYFAMNGLMFLVICVRLRQDGIARMRLAFMSWAAINASLGATDIAARLVGAGDVLAPIRTARYAILSEQSVGGFFRVIGGFPEASAFAGAAVPALAFCLVDWQRTQSRFSLVVGAVLTLLLVFSTSSTAYAGLAALAAVYGLAATASILGGRLSVHQIVLIMSMTAAFSIFLAVYIFDPHLVEPLTTMIENATVNKVSSDSAIERGKWNVLSIGNFFDTYGLGVGIGSTRSSSWALSVLGQLGVVGLLGFGTATLVFIFALLKPQRNKLDALAASASAAALASVVTASFGGSGSDPGMIFFLALAVVSASLGTHRVAVRDRQRTAMNPIEA